jgi:hypothetical protein
MRRATWLVAALLVACGARTPLEDDGVASHDAGAIDSSVRGGSPHDGRTPTAALRTRGPALMARPSTAGGRRAPSTGRSRSSLRPAIVTTGTERATFLAAWQNEESQRHRIDGARVLCP